MRPPQIAQTVPLPEDVDNEAPKPRGPDQLPLFSSPEKLYGAIQEIDEAAMDKMKKQTQRINVVPILLALFVPWITLLTVFGAVSFYTHYAYPMTNLFVPLIAVGLAFNLASGAMADRAQGLDFFFKGYIATILVIFIPIVWLCGDYNFWTFMQPAYDIEHLATYSGVNPSSMTLRDGLTVPTSGRRYQDAGKIYFNSDTKVDINRSMSFKVGDQYCVAPIVNSKCKQNCGVDFWAVGMNCCSDSAADFRCGEVNNPRAKSGLRMVVDHQRQFYRLAVLQAEGVHHLVSTHPLFFYWMQDPVAEIKHNKNRGYKTFLYFMFSLFFGSIIAIFVAMKWRLKPADL